MTSKRGPYSSPAQAERRLRILRATLNLLETEGISGVTLTEVARLAEVGEKTVRNIFGTRDDLLVKAAALQLDTLQVSPEVIELPPGIPRILAFTESTMNQFRAMPEFMVSIISIVFQSNDNREVAQRRVRHGREIAYAALVAANKNKELKSGTDLDALSDLIAGNQWGGVFLWQKGLLTLDQFIGHALINHCVTLIPFCVGARKKWLEAKLKDLLSQQKKQQSVKEKVSENSDSTQL